MNRKENIVVQRGFLLFKSLFERNPSVIGRQRLICLFCYTFMVVVGLVGNLVGMTGPREALLVTLNAVLLAAVLIVFFCFLCDWFSLVRTLELMTIIAQLFTSNEMIFCALYPTEYSLMLIVGNMVLLAGNMLFSITAHLHLNSYVLCVLSICTYIACVFITQNTSLLNFCFLIVVMFLFLCLLGDWLVRNNERMREENDVLKEEEREILEMLHLTKEDAKIYVELVCKDHGENEAEQLIGMFTPETRNNLIRHVENYINRQEIECKDLRGLFPELTPSEISICRLVLQGKKQKDLCAILGKSESNISCQRTNIRRKLGLQPQDNLREALKKRSVDCHVGDSATV